MARKESQKLSDIEVSLLKFIPRFTDEQGYAPNFREI